MRYTGKEEGAGVGRILGIPVEGTIVMNCPGGTEGVGEGMKVGPTVGTVVGVILGWIEGFMVGASELNANLLVGTIVGC